MPRAASGKATPRSGTTNSSRPRSERSIPTTSSGSQSSYRPRAHTPRSFESSSSQWSDYRSRGTQTVEHKRTQTPRRPACSTSSISSRSTATSTRSGSSSAIAEVAISPTVLRATAGYSGHLPQVNSENIFGSNFSETNRAAAREQRKLQRSQSEFRPAPRTARTPPPGIRPLPHEKPPFGRGAEVPGYTGHVPGIISGNLVNVSTPRAVKAGWPNNDVWPAMQSSANYDDY
eukprot:TRINITY_DN46852_c0_g1_i1.p1 TRINITY_DN46852_c0_g1~~TRINITY_DN46852_c0_g1_i1.p1  ORF type:complete len:239 (+),score=18.12 TRINITY_DN46852_c0_g1_i1:23-718(+)